MHQCHIFLRDVEVRVNNGVNGDPITVPPIVTPISRAINGVNVDSITVPTIATPIIRATNLVLDARQGVLLLVEIEILKGVLLLVEVEILKLYYNT